MKIEIRTHAFLVQACKLSCLWVKLVNVFDGKDRLSELFTPNDPTVKFLDGMKGILKSIPGIERVDFGALTYAFGENTLEEFLINFTVPFTDKNVKKLLKNMLKAVPDGVIGIELDEENVNKLNILMGLRHVDLGILPEFRDPKYNTFCNLE